MLRGEAANAVPPTKPAPASPGQDSEAKSTEQAVLDQKISAPVPSSSSCLPDAMQTGAPITCWARPPTSPLRCFFERLLRITLGLVDCPGDHTRLPQQMSGGAGLERDLHQQGQHTHRGPPVLIHTPFPLQNVASSLTMTSQVLQGPEGGNLDNVQGAANSGRVVVPEAAAESTFRRNQDYLEQAISLERAQNLASGGLADITDLARTQNMLSEFLEAKSEGSGSPPTRPIPTPFRLNSTSQRMKEILIRRSPEKPAGFPCRSSQNKRFRGGSPTSTASNLPFAFRSPADTTDAS